MPKKVGPAQPGKLRGPQVNPHGEARKDGVIIWHL